MKYLNISKGAFVVQKVDGKGMDVARKESAKLNVQLLADPNIDGKDISTFFNVDETKSWVPYAIKSLRYAYAVEHGMLDYLSSLKKSDASRKGISILWNYLYKLTNNTFFVSDAIARDNALFKYFIENKNITARLSYEEPKKGLPEYTDEMKIKESVYKKIYDEDADKSVFHVALYAELLNRLLVLKSTIEYTLVGREKGETAIDDFISQLEEAGLSQNIKNAANIFKEQSYCYLYPQFWQIFIYLFGGFIMEEKEDTEKQLLSEITSIPIEEIDNALSAFDVLFPLTNCNWIVKVNSYSKIKHMILFPLPLRGIGVNFRRWLYVKDEEPTLENLYKQFSGRFTALDLTRWNNNSCMFLSKYEV